MDPKCEVCGAPYPPTFGVTFCDFKEHARQGADFNVNMATFTNFLKDAKTPRVSPMQVLGDSDGAWGAYVLAFGLDETVSEFDCPIPDGVKRLKLSDLKLE